MSHNNAWRPTSGSAWCVSERTRRALLSTAANRLSSASSMNASAAYLELSTHHEAPKEPYLLYIGLRPSGGHLPLGGCLTALFLEANRLGWPYAGGKCLLLRAEFTVLYY